MSDINISINKTLLHEGGYVNNPLDSGGPTKYGITSHDLPGVDIQNLTVPQAVVYYTEHYVKPLYVQIQNQEVLDKLFDFGVLFGVVTAIMNLQRVVKVTSDGIFGSGTLQAVNEFDPSNLIKGYKLALSTHVENIILAHPEDKAFYHGWINRINS